MALHTIEGWIASPEYDKIYIADTNFIFKSVHCTNADVDQYARDDYKLLAAFREKLRQCGCTILFNAVTRHELLRLLRQLMIKAALAEGDIDGATLCPEILALRWNADGTEKTMDRFTKDMLKAGYIKFFNDLLGEEGEHLRAEYKRVIEGCQYRSYGGNLDWKDAEKTMGQYGLDSCDAMILNAGVKTENCAGLLTADADFRFCYDVKNFDIILPQRLRGSPKPVSLDPYA